MYKNILIAVDGSKASDKALEHGLKLAKAIGAPVHIVTVTELWSALTMSAGIEAGMGDPIGEYEEAVAKSARKVLDAAAEAASREGVTNTVEHVPDQHPSDAIVAVAQKQKSDLIVMGSHGRRGLDRLLIGSQANEVLLNAGLPVLVVR